jgi:hypothetical protein
MKYDLESNHTLQLPYSIGWEQYVTPTLMESFYMGVIH